MAPESLPHFFSRFKFHCSHHPYHTHKKPEAAVQIAGVFVIMMKEKGEGGAEPTVNLLLLQSLL
jgi:hypothetical protein